ncbi:MAG TPA: taurine catabolism dioxygenase TauD [Rhodospirillaceae bacterium]|nr:taurine catabolism dioxygenase TauD [Rhodospirillaceae bacterium]HAA91842.1 taurine catabolism dioxygenase TauD [Rhodospirillaceae bacterium]HAT36111.1 taurine catabolism dioxygenase TauD [Rhodospirillaceae bacterium]
MSALSAKPLDEDPAAWRGEDMMTRDDWRAPLTDAHRAEIATAIDLAKQSGKNVLDLTKEDFPLPTLGPYVAALNADLEGGRGFTVIEGLPGQELDDETGKIAIWGLGLYMGESAKQDGAGNLIHSVRDIGQSVDKTDNIRSYQTADPISWHNDGADVFLLYCLRTGKSGGDSRLVSAVEIFNEVARRRPDLAETLQRDYWFDTRGQRPDGARIEVMPVYNRHNGLITANMKYRYIHTAQRFADVPRLTGRQREALQMAQDVANEPGMAMEFPLKPGDILVANNYVTFHGRTSFEDWEEAEKKRHMLRLWLTIPNGRPLPTCFKDSRIYGEAYDRRVKAQKKT